MIEYAKRLLLAGVGMAALTREKAEALARELASVEKLSEAEGKKLIDEVIERTETARKDLEAQVEKIVHKVVGRLNLTTKADLEDLERRLQTLQESLDRRTSDSSC